MLEIIFSNDTRGKIGRVSIEKIVSLAARFSKKIRGTVEVAVVGDKKIQTLNKKYRGKNKVTDVLSFSWLSGDFLGQIFICYPQIVRQAKEYEISVDEEFARMLVHGLLHLVGHDHVKKIEASRMFKIQERIVDKLKM